MPVCPRNLATARVHCTWVQAVSHACRAPQTSGRSSLLCADAFRMGREDAIDSVPVERIRGRRQFLDVPIYVGLKGEVGSRDNKRWPMRKKVVVPCARLAGPADRQPRLLHFRNRDGASTCPESYNDRHGRTLFRCPRLSKVSTCSVYFLRRKPTSECQMSLSFPSGPRNDFLRCEDVQCH